MENHDTDDPPLVDQPETGTKTRRLRLGQRLRVFRGKRIELELSGEVSKILFELMNQTAHQPEELFIKGLLLYKVAVDAADEGKRIAILDEDGEIDQEISGF